MTRPDPATGRQLGDLAGRVGRDGRLALEFARRGPRSMLLGVRSVPPLQAQVPLGLDDPAAVVVMLNPTGVVLGGDRLSVDVLVAAGAHACLTTASATRVHRAGSVSSATSQAGPASQDVCAVLGQGATLEWVPDHVIPHPGAVWRQRIDVELAPDARLILVDAAAAGRIARGEAWHFARFESRLDVRDAGGTLFTDAYALEGDRRWAELGHTGGRPYFATVVAVGPEGWTIDPGPIAAAALADSAAREIAELTVVGGARLPRRGCAFRCLAASAPALTDAIAALWGALRAALLGLPPLDLRKY